MVRLQNSPAPRQARPARPNGPPPFLPRVRGPAAPEGHRPVARPPGDAAPLPASSPGRAAPSGGAGWTDGRTEEPCSGAAAGGSAAPSARPGGPAGVGSRACTDNWRRGSEAGAPDLRALNLRAQEGAPPEGCGLTGKGGVTTSGCEEAGTPPREASARGKRWFLHRLRVLVWRVRVLVLSTSFPKLYQSPEKAKTLCNHPIQQEA